MKKNLLLPLNSGILLSFLILFGIFGFTNIKSNELDTPLRIVVYKGKNYSSYNSELRKTVRNLKYLSINDKVSSVIVDKGTVARFYRASNYTACSFEIVGPFKVPKLDEYDCGCCSINSNGWDNEISSIELYSNSSERQAGIYGDFTKRLKVLPFNMW